MSEIQLFKQRAVFVELPEPKKFGPKMDKKLSITYTRPDTETPNTPLTVGAFENTLDEATKEYLKPGKLKPGDEICIAKAQTGRFWTLVSISEVANAPVRTPNTDYTSKNNYTNNKATGTYSAGGQTIGMAIKAAVDWTIAKDGSLQDVAKTAREIMKLSAIMDVEYNAGLFKPAVKAITVTTKEVVEATQEIDELENLDFN